jgi:hypothetical protein
MSDASGVTARLRTWADPVFGADLRSLGLFRIGLAAVLLWDLLDRSKSVAAHYTETGTIPSSLLPLITNGAKFSIHYWLSGHLWAQWALLAAAFAAGAALLLGWRTRWAAVASWYLLSSLQVRNPLISWEGADKLLCILLFWCVVAPVGARLSLDARRAARAGREPAASWLCTPATAIFVLQVFAIYFITGLAKTGQGWASGAALSYALRVDFFGGPLGPWARQFDGLLALLSHATIVIERFGPFLLLVPFHTWILRLVLMAVFWGFHLGILILMGVGFFSPLSMVMWLPLLPRQVWDGIAGLRGGARGSEAAPRLRTPRLAEVGAALLCAYLLVSIGSKTAVFFLGRGVSVGPLETAASLLRVRQHWPMFSPEPPPFDLWPVMRGRLASGRAVDAFRGGPPTVEQPASVAAYFPSFKWKIHLWWLGHKSWEEQQPHLLWEPLVDHLCHAWNQRHEGLERLESVDVVLRVEAIQPQLPEDPVHDWTVVRGHRCPHP